ncbi:MAG: FAD:protein FMN transferase [Opitutaceae bacterium]
MTKPHVFTHEAMKTLFTFRIITEDPQLARNVAYASIALLDEIENTLSRYIEGSDVWLINNMQAGETRFLSEHCYACLRIALEAYVQTGGLFDITIGKQIEHRKNELEGAPPALSGQLMVDPDKPAIHCIEAGREIDLGGIGKGYALDEIQKLMEGWGIESALLAAGGSTQLAFGSTPWTVELSGDSFRKEVELKDTALSASGIGIQGSHIVSPRDTSTDYAHHRLWCIQDTAAMADAWSTAVMLMTTDELLEVADQSLCIYFEGVDRIDRLAR